MKTVTEFDGFLLRRANAVKLVLIRTKASTEISAEELSLALATELKLEGEKLTHIVNALRMIDLKRLEDLRRIVVMSLTPEEKAPEGAVKEGDHYFLASYLPSLRPARQARGGRRDGRGGGRGGRGGKPGDGKEKRFNRRGRGADNKNPVGPGRSTPSPRT